MPSGSEVVGHGAIRSQKSLGMPSGLQPLPDSFMGHDDATLEQEFLHIAVAQGEAIGEPDTMANDCAGKAVVLVTCGVGWRSHA